jgi:hypothetical protein
MYISHLDPAVRLKEMGNGVVHDIQPSVGLALSLACVQYSLRLGMHVHVSAQAYAPGMCLCVCVPCSL